MMIVLWIIIGYLVGSIPFGFLIGKISGKNVLEVGWRKTSASNVFKNVGKWQGVLVGLLDAAKGYFVVYFVQKLGMPGEVQVLSGAAAVAGHNWSIFLKFSGGRGVATMGGAFLALSWQLFLFSAIPFALTTLIWDGAIGTILSFFFGIPLAVYYGKFETAGLFLIICFILLMLKRLSPTKEIIEFKKREKEYATGSAWNLVKNRLLFDRDESRVSFRILKILKEEDAAKLMRLAKVLTLPIVLPPKIAWSAAVFGFKVAKKPIDILLSPSEKGVTELGAEDFKKMMIAAAKKIVIWQEDINRINVFPVADKDTGYNLAATLLGIEGFISGKNYDSLKELASDVKEAAIVNARGNAGMIFTGYLSEAVNRIRHFKKVNSLQIAFAMKKAKKAARNSIMEPIEGTILDVMDAAGDKAYISAKENKNIVKVLEQARKAAQNALDETPKKLAVLRQYNVVDAGGLGYVKILEAWIESLKGRQRDFKKEEFVASPLGERSQRMKYPYEVVLDFQRLEGMDVKKIHEDLTGMGDSLEVLELGKDIKLHIHTDRPEEIIGKYKNFPNFESQVEDMSGQKEISGRKPLGLVVDQIADLPKTFLEENEIEEVPFTSRLPNGKILSSVEEVYEELRKAIRKKTSFPTTSAPTFKTYLAAYQKSFKKFEKFLVITPSSKLSGAYSSARIARSIYKKPDKLNIYVLDSFTGEVGEGLVAYYAQKLISQGENAEKIVQKLQKLCQEILLLGEIDDFRYVAAGGRIKVLKIFLKPLYILQKAGIRFSIGLKKGKLRFLDVNFGKHKAEILVKKINSIRGWKDIVVAIAHADDLESALDLKKEIEKFPGIKVLFISQASPVVATHTGPGALIVAFYPIDAET